MNPIVLAIARKYLESLKFASQEDFKLVEGFLRERADFPQAGIEAWKRIQSAQSSNFDLLSKLADSLGNRGKEGDSIEEKTKQLVGELRSLKSEISSARELLKDAKKLSLWKRIKEFLGM